MTGWPRKQCFTLVLTAATMFAGIPLPAGASGIETVGTGVAIALPLVAGGVSLYKDDIQGAEQLVYVTGLTVGTALILKEIVREERPDHSDFHSFPSDTSALAFGPAAYLWDRYGWEYGAPAFAAGAFVAYSRVDAKQHHWWDTGASALIAIGYSKLITSQFRGTNVTSELNAAPDGAFLHLALDW